MSTCKSALASLILLSSALLVHPVVAETNPVVQTNAGPVRGTVSEYVSGINVFKGVRFADPATGQYRWAHPPHPTRWTETRNATEFGSDCAQLGMGPGSGAGVTGSEDCLFLNIWTPENFTQESNYPVYLWTYGGRFSGGSGSALTYDGSGLAAKGAVVITYNYRLGALGFLAHPELSEESGYNASGNWGLQDQIAVLHWTNENIQNFGGNPKQITLGGQSAGSGVSLAMVYSPLATGLFQGAVAESGARGPHDPMTGSLATSHRNKTTAEAQGVEYLKLLNVSSIAEARELPVETILSTGSNSDTIFVGTPFANNQAYMEPPLYRPVIDGYVLLDTYAGTLASHSQNDVPVLTGNNKDESGASTATTASLQTYQAQMQAIFEPLGLWEQFQALWPAADDAEAGAQTNNFYRNQSLASSYAWADAWAQGGGKSPVWTYFWTHAPPGQSQGAFHGSEINYALHNIPWGTDLQGQAINWTAQDYAIQDVMATYWYNFISTGDPNGGASSPSSGNATWLASTEAGKQTMELGDAWGSISVGSDEAISFFQDFFSQEIAW
ncbi:carboxylesterase [Xylariales sp. PMI_506]|nr:carboxylesterase [Xylariales sp. PMI_506]